MYLFNPPGRLLPSGSDSLWGRIKFFRGDAVVRYTNGSFKQSSTYDPDETGVDKDNHGGHQYTVDDAEAALLTAAGYGPYLTVVS